MICHSSAGLAMINLCTKFEISMPIVKIQKAVKM